jgi:Raf kinase inhibitor-like YbhB/YbcL family protein
VTAPRRGALALACVLPALVLAACSSDGRTLSPPGPDQTLSIITTSSSSSTSSTVVEAPATTGPVVTNPISSPSLSLRMSVPWADGGEIAPRFTCAGDDVSPSITWTGVPAEAVELAVLFTDLDSDPPGFVHWLVAGLDPASTGIAEGRVPAGAVQATNGFGDAGYGGPCPPSGTHTYLVALYALREESEIDDGAEGIDDLLTTLETRAISSTAISGTATAPGGAPATPGDPSATAGTETTAGAVATVPAGPTTTRAGTITIAARP